jgi:hypothetical protein
VHLKVDGLDVAALNRLEPFLAAQSERSAGARSDEHEIGVNQRPQPVHVLAAQGVAPFVLERLDQLVILSGHDQTSVIINAS